MAWRVAGNMDIIPKQCVMHWLIITKPEKWVPESSALLTLFVFKPSLFRVRLPIRPLRCCFALCMLCSRGHSVDLMLCQNGFLFSDVDYFTIGARYFIDYSRALKTRKRALDVYRYSCSWHVFNMHVFSKNARQSHLLIICFIIYLFCPWWPLESFCVSSFPDDIQCKVLLIAIFTELGSAHS